MKDICRGMPGVLRVSVDWLCEFKTEDMWRVLLWAFVEVFTIYLRESVDRQIQSAYIHMLCMYVCQHYVHPWIPCVSSRFINTLESIHTYRYAHSMVPRTFLSPLDSTNLPSWNLIAPFHSSLSEVILHVGKCYNSLIVSTSSRMLACHYDDP